MAVSNTVPSVLRLTLTNPTSPRALMCNAAIGNERSITFHLNNRGSSQESNNQLNEIYSIDYSNTNVLTDLLESIQTTPVLNYTRTMLAKVSTMTPCSLVINSSNENIGKCNVTNSTNIKNKNQIFPINNNMNYNKKPINEDTNGGNTSVLANNITTVTSHSTTNTINMVNSVVNGTMANLMVKRCVDNLGNKEKSDQVQVAGRKTRVKAASPTRHGPQQCQVCSKVFGNASALAKHKLTHSDERKYACVLCSKAFKRQDHLNGHMLTHRNKKPYECKAMGCGKSYCDARSLRRHIENHHNTKIVKMTTTGQPLTQLPAIPGNEAMNELNITTGNDEMKSPLGNVSLHLLNEIKKGSVDNELSHTIQSISPITGNEGLTRQQLDLISQIMQQTKQANANIFANSSKSFQRPRTWNMQTQQQQQQVQVKVSNNDPTNANGPNLGSAAITVKMEQKAVECNLCHRKFKNIPALNGHMRLHGGYVKKDAEAKKYEKKESTGPPLQTASIGVRALIEEKIISKRGKQLKKSLIIPATNLLKKRKQFDNVIDEQQQNGTNETKFNQPETNEIINNGTHCKTLLQDVVQELNSNLRRNYIPETKDATLIELLKRGTKLAVKKILDNNEPSGNDEHNKNIVHSIDSNNVAVLTSHPISTTSTFSTPEEMSVSLSVECETNTPPIGIPISQPPNDATDIFSLAYSNDNTGNSFFDTDVYNVADNAMLLQAVDSIHLFPESTNASQLDDVALNDYTLAGNGGYNEAQIFTNDIGNADQINSVLHSPLTDNLSDVTSMNRKHFTIYGCNKKAETIMNETISPLPSPLAYPTPPASHEAVTQVSPFLDEVHPLPDVSSIFENKNNLRYLQTDNNGEFDKDNGSMYMTEKEKILKLKNELYNDSKIVLGVAELYKDTQCESSLISTPNLRRNTVNSLSQFNTDNLSLLDDAHHILNVGRNDSSSLSASFFTGSIPTAEEVKETLVEVLSNEINSQSFTDNGEDLYYLPVFGLQSHMMSTSDDPLLSSSPKDFSHKNNPQNYKFDFNVFTPPSSKKLKCDSDTTKKRSNSKEFETKLTETHASNELDTITSENFWHGQNSPEVMITNRRKDGIKLHKNGPFISKLKRNCRDHYTPPPILDPIRSGQGLFCSIDNSIESNDVVFDFNETNEEITKYANTSKVNIGSDFQANIPNICNTFEQQKRCDPCAELQWNPVTINNYCQLNRFVEFAKSPSSLMGGHSEEIALRALLEANGNIQVARLALLQTSPSIPNRWTSHEIELFLKGIEVYGKDFPRIANEIRTKTSSDCVQFYYIWKKLFANTKSTYLVTELHKSCCVHLTLSNETSLNHQHQTNNENRPHVCEMPDCSASFTSKAALHGHTRIHCIGRNLNTTQQNGPQLPGTINGLVPKDDYPCKVCGKVFNKIKSRSAHMKSHRPQEVESNGVGT